MSEYKVANRYAKALIDVHQKNNTLDQGYKDMVEFRNILRKTAPLESLLKSPIIHGHKKVAVLNAIFEKQFMKETMGFFTLVIDKKREFYLGVIADMFIEQYNLIRNIGTATVTSAVDLDAKTTDSVRQFIEKFTSKTIELTSKIDASLIGGIVIHADNQLYDASISGNLNKAKQQLLNTYISK